MFNNVMRNIMAALLGLGILLNGVALMPALAQAKETNASSHVGTNIKASKPSGDQNQAHRIKISNDVHLNLGKLGLDLESTTSPPKPARTALRNAVKDANADYRDAQKTAKVQLKGSIDENTNQADLNAALRTYFSSLLTAFHARTLAIETAFQAFIDTNFGVNHPPVANSQNVTVSKNSSTSITLTGSDQEGSALTYIIVTTTAHGSLSSAAPNLTYTPTTDFTGTDSFTFKVNDGSQNSTLTTVSITVN